MDVELIKVLAALFRNAVESTTNLPVPLDQFPKGDCGETSLLLAQWLWEHGVESHYYCGRRADGATHAWLEVGDIIVDITGDQFEEFQHPVYVGPVTSFHMMFSTRQAEQDMKNGFHCYDAASVARLSNEYKMIMKSL